MDAVVFVARCVCDVYESGCAVYMQAAFFFAGIFPPPAAGSEVFAWLNRSGTWGTANTYKTLLVQGVGWNMMLLNKLGDFLC